MERRRTYKPGDVHPGTGRVIDPCVVYLDGKIIDHVAELDGAEDPWVTVRGRVCVFTPWPPELAKSGDEAKTRWFAGRIRWEWAA